MTKCLLADYRVHARVSQRRLQHVALDYAGDFLKPDAFGQLLCAYDARWSQFNTGDVGSILVSEIAYGAAKTSTEISYARSMNDLCPSCQFFCSCNATIMILIMWK